MSTGNITQIVKEKYGAAALLVEQGGDAACCSSAPLSTPGCDSITSNLYDTSEIGLLPENAVKASLGCGNPTALAQLHAGETVLDLGSGAGIDGLHHRHRSGGDWRHILFVVAEKETRLNSESQLDGGR